MKHQSPQSHESYHSNYGLKHEMWERTGADALAAFKDNKAAEEGKWDGEARPGGDFEEKVREIPTQAVMDMVEMFPPAVASKTTGIENTL